MLTSETGDQCVLDSCILVTSWIGKPVSKSQRARQSWPAISASLSDKKVLRYGGKKMKMKFNFAWEMQVRHCYHQTGSVS